MNVREDIESGNVLARCEQLFANTARNLGSAAGHSSGAGCCGAIADVPVLATW